MMFRRAQSDSSGYERVSGIIFLKSSVLHKSIGFAKSDHVNLTPDY